MEAETGSHGYSGTWICSERYSGGKDEEDGTERAGPRQTLRTGAPRKEASAPRPSEPTTSEPGLRAHGLRARPTHRLSPGVIAAHLGAAWMDRRSGRSQCDLKEVST